MNKPLQWIIGISVILIALAVVASTLLPFFLPQTAWSGPIGPGHMYGGGGMMGGWGMMPFFGIGMLFGPLLFIGLIVLGVVWLIRNTATSAAPQPPIASAVCAHCGKPLQPGWKTCPYCGEKI